MSETAREQRKVRSLVPCPACSVRAMTGYVGSMQVTCESCWTVTPQAVPIPMPPPRVQPAAREPVVYYLRFGDRVKIGTTIDLTRRMQSIPYDELLATEPGSYDVEKQRHRQFHAARIYANREWFTLTDDLLAHIQGLQ